MGAINQFPVASSGGSGGSRLTISNNSDGRLIKANGSVSSVTALSQLSFDGSEFDVATDLYIQGSTNNLFLDGTDGAGDSQKFKISIVGGNLLVEPQ